MKILFLTSRLPYPPNRGDKLRVFNFLSRLSKKHSITLLSFITSESQREYVKELEKYCQRVEVVLLKPWQSYLNCLLNIFSPRPLQVAYYDSRQLQAKVTNLLSENKFDAVYVHLFRMAQYAEQAKGINRVLDLCDAVSLHLQRTLKHKRGILWPVYLLEWLKVRKYEKKLINKFEKIIFISATDKQAILQDMLDSDKIDIVPNGVDFEYFKPAIVTDNHKVPKVAFLGYLSTFYNLDAIKYFYSEIFPTVKKQISDVKFLIVGANCPAELKTLAKTGDIELINNAADTRPFLSQASVFVCPLRIGSGQQNKILEAMSLGLPVVTTSIGFSGLNAEKDKEIIVEDNPFQFADKVVGLIKNAQHHKDISTNARRFIEKRYAWEESVLKLESLLEWRRL